MSVQATAPAPPPQAVGYYPQGQPAGQPAGQQSSQQSSTTVVIAGNDNPPMGMALRDCPITTKCPSCKSNVVTQIKFEIGCITVLATFLLCLFGFYLCCFIPCCVGRWKDVVHLCPNCKYIIGKYKRM
ncbi:LITAF domain-containing protein-like [Mytilus californianus]|uniref:LITAF domain-containing protein-like n=1 Tax=Mytilus californianus TaxID=6549 RepID=UPI002246D787|nr:LITAF domain-containing protein-like [Mytilus californianus]